MFSSKDLFFTPTSGAYTVSKSLRFRASASAYLNRTPGTATDNKKWTWSGWLKRGSLGGSAYTPLFDGYSNSSNWTSLFFLSDQIIFYNFIAGVDTSVDTVAVLRDPSAWYHIVFVFDSANATAANRGIIYVNGVKQTVNNTYGAITLNEQSFWNQSSSYVNYIGRRTDGGLYADGYMAEVNFIDGQALTPSSFGAYDTNGIWQPAAYTGSYGNNGFYLKFTDVGATSGSNTGYGKDFAGTNYWTTNNFGTTSTATTYDSMLDSPTNATGDIGNYAVWSPLVLFPNTTYQSTMSNANLLMTRSAGGQGGAVTTIGATSGKYYAEITVTAAGSSFPKVAVIADNNPPSINSANEYYPGGGTTSVAYRSDGGKTYNNSTTASWGSTYTTNDVIGIAFDADSGKVWFGKQTGGTGSMTWQASGDPAAGTNPANTLGTGVPFYFSAGGESGVQMSFNTGQRPLSATAPSGFSALNTQNLTTPTITNGAQYMAAVTYTGTGSSQTITASSTNSGNNPNGTTFQPDFVWVKGRSGATDHALYDAVRGVQKQIESNTTTAETTETTGLTAFTSSGFTTGALAQMNTNTATYVAWEWNAGGSNATNTSGSITSTVSANTSAGFSVVTYTGTGANATVGHGLGVAPSFIIVKNRDSGAQAWHCYHASLGNSAVVFLDSSAAQSTGSADWWNNTSPTSSVFSVGVGGATNGNTQKIVAYCFAPVSGYSVFGNYTGNGSTDGTFVYTGFRPRYLLLKIYSAGGGSWQVKDTSRDTYNAATTTLYPNLSNAEASDTAVDILSNGFKLRASTGENASGATVIYAAFAENPLRSVGQDNVFT